MAIARSFLTGQQKRVLELRHQGYTQEEVAKVLKTSRANVSIIEKRGHQNIRRAQATLKEWERIMAPVAIQIKTGTDIMDIPKKIYEEADHLAIKVNKNTLDIITQIHEIIPDSVRHRRTVHPLNIFISSSGEISFD